jgi:hypothetical protein
MISSAILGIFSEMIFLEAFLAVAVDVNVEAVAGPGEPVVAIFASS